MRFLLLALILTVTVGFTGTAPSRYVSDDIHVIVYGDSLSDNNNAASCDWCAPLLDDGWTIWNAATGGARMYDDDVADPNACESVTYDGCYAYIEHQMVPHTDLSGCQVGTALSPNGGSAGSTPLYVDGSGAEVLTCLEDLPSGPQSVVVVWEGANSASRTNHTAWTSTYEPLWQAAAARVETALATAGNPCVIVITPPIWSDQDGSTEYTETNLVIEDIRSYWQATTTTSCVVVDLYQAVLDVEAGDGANEMFALYQNCDEQARGEVDSPTRDCVHFSTTGSEWAGELIQQGIREAWLSR